MACCLRNSCSTAELYRQITCLLSQSLTSISDATDYNPEASLMSSIFVMSYGASQTVVAILRTGGPPAATSSCSRSLCVLRALARTQNTQTSIKGLVAAQPQHVREYCHHGPKSPE